MEYPLRLAFSLSRRGHNSKRIFKVSGLLIASRLMESCNETTQSTQRKEGGRRENKEGIDKEYRKRGENRIDRTADCVERKMIKKNKVVS